MPADPTHLPDPFKGHNVTWEGVRVANLLEFASATPDQKLAWLGQMLELYQEIHGIAGGAQRGKLRAGRAAVRPTIRPLDRLESPTV